MDARTANRVRNPAAGTRLCGRAVNGSPDTYRSNSAMMRSAAAAAERPVLSMRR